MVKDESALSIPPEWEEKFIIKRIGEEDIVITLQQRNGILESLNRGDQFVQIGKYTLMLNAIKSIDPYWEPDNIPPRPKPIEIADHIEGNTMVMRIENQEKIDLWDKIFKDKLTAERGAYG